MTLGGSDEVNTNHIYGSYGIYEGKDRLRAKGLQLPKDMQAVYLANHTRAILDLLYRSLTRHSKVYNLTGASTDWLDTYDQGVILLEQAVLLAPQVSRTAQDELKKWVDGERWALAEEFRL